MGRKKIELTDELREKTLHYLSRGFSVQRTCDKVGVCMDVFYRWQKEISDFSEACQRARQKALSTMKSNAEECIAAKVNKHEGDSWRAAAWFLSHKHPAEYAEKRILDQTLNMKDPYTIINEAIDSGGEAVEDDN